MKQRYAADFLGPGTNFKDIARNCNLQKAELSQLPRF